MRLGLRLIKGLSQGEGERIAASRQPVATKGAAYSGLSDIMRRADVSARALEAIAKGDGFGSLGLEPAAGAVAVRALAGQRWHELPLFAHATRRHDDLAGREETVTLPAAHPGEDVAADYRSLGLSLKDASGDVFWQSRWRLMAGRPARWRMRRQTASVCVLPGW